MPLLTSRRFAPLLITQTLGALNDNLFKNALVVLVLFQGGHSSGPALAAAAGGVFILPYVLLSATAGQVADRFEMARTIRFVKLAEVGLMLLATAGFLLGSTGLLFVVLFGMGVHSTFFGPLKYGILPSLLRERELVAGNGLVEAGTFLGILAGTVAGSALIAWPGGAGWVSAAGLGVALCGVAGAAFVPASPPRAPDLRIGWNVARETAALLALARGNRVVWRSVLALSWFWVMGATLLAELPTVVRDMGAAPPVFTLMLAVFSMGVGLGSVLCPRLLRGEVSARLVPAAALGLSVFLADFGFAVGHGHGLASVGAVLESVAGWRMLADLLLLAACGGVYSVPLYAMIQERSAVAARARMVAANNVVNAAAMALAAAVAAGLALWGIGPVAVLWLAALANLAVTVWTLRLLPQDAVKAVFRWYFRALHGVSVRGMEHVPPPGARAIVVVNHQSFADGCLVGAFLPGSPMFVVDVRIARQAWARPFLSVVRFFTTDQTNPYSVRAMVQAVRDGERLVVFPEGRITRTGSLMKMYEGAGLVADRAGAVIVPVRIDGLLATPLSRMGGRVRRQWFPPLSLTVLPPVRVEVVDGARGRARRRAIGAMLRVVMERAAFEGAETGRSLFAALLDAQARQGAGTAIIEDTALAPLSYGRIVLGAAVLGRQLAALAPEGGRIGVMLPNANGAVVTFMALQAFGRVPAMLNVSAGAAAMLGACEAAGVGVVLSSRAFVEKGKLEAVAARMAEGVRFVWLEDVRAGIGTGAKLRGWVAARTARRLPGAAAHPDRAAVVLFTSGSEGVPKGVVLSHRNILANVAQVSAVIDFNASDRVFNAMPMFHAFGLTGATLLPLLSGVRSFLYPSPLHYKIIPELIYGTDSTIGFGTETFLAGWARFAHPYDFYAMRYIVCGAERVRDETRRLYGERFGVRLLEGYGATETAPVLALNTFMHGRAGSVGRLLPGVEHRLDAVPGIEDGGRLLVRGPNVMLGYLRQSAPGVLEPVEGGWYDTGDVCTVDAERFVTLVARAKRFAKIGGEMVSMPAAEQLAMELWPDAVHAVVAVEDRRKGEALLLLTTCTDATSGALLAKARERGVAEIAVPRAVRVVAALPMLGSGKIDYVAVGRMAAGERAAA